MNVNQINNKDQMVSGTATPGAVITVKTSADATSNLGTATVGADGKYTVNLSKAVKAYDQVYVYATNPTTKAYYYEIIHVQPTTSTTDQTTTTKPNTSTTTNPTTKPANTNFTVKAINGTWTSNTVNGYSQVLTVTEQDGFNQTLYKNGKKVQTLVAYGNYQTSEVSRNLWKLTYKGHGATKSNTIYLRYTAANQFTLVNASNQVVQTTAGEAPAATWNFTQN